MLTNTFVSWNICGFGNQAQSIKHMDIICEFRSTARKPLMQTEGEEV